MGVGAMVGAGIFALLGEAGARAGNAVYVAFIIAGFISLLSAYSYAKLGIRYPSSGGIVEYLAQAYGSGYTTGVLSIILYLSVTVVMALVARAFGTYSVALFASDSPGFVVNIFVSAVVIVLVLINAMGSSAVSRLEKVIVVTKVTILAIFIGAGLLLIKPELLFATTESRPPLDVLGTVAICLLAYHGFGVITNTVEDMPNPAVTLPRSLYGAIGLVMVLYIGVAIAVFGNLPLSEIVRAKDYALAEAAIPIFGKLGFSVMAIAALMSTASSLNANLYSTAKMTYLLAKDGELPEFEAAKVWHRGTGGLFTTAALVLIIANTLDLSKIAVLGSIVYLIVYTAVHWGHLKKLTPETGASRLVVGLAFLVNLAVLAIFAMQTANRAPLVLYLLALLVVVAFTVEVVMQKTKGRTVRSAIH